MRTALDADPSRLDKHETNFVAKIRQYGWFCTNVFADAEGPGFSYSTGFWVNLGFPEVIIFSLPDKTRHETLWHLFRQITSGRPIEVGRPIGDMFANGSGVLIPVAVSQLKEYCGWSRWFYGGDDFKCLQLVWPDMNEIFPWQPGFAADLRDAQPDLSEANWSGLGSALPPPG